MRPTPPTSWPHASGRPPRGFAPLVELLPSSSRRVSFDYRAKRFVRAAALPPLERHHGFKEIFSPRERERLLAPDWRSESTDPLDSWRRRFAETAGAPLLARLQDVDLGIYLADDLLVKTDRMSMAHSLEARVPYLDPVVSDLALALPSAMKVRGLSKKRLLRRAASTLVPQSILRARKRGFSIPAAAWLRGELKPLAEEVLISLARPRAGVFRAGGRESNARGSLRPARGLQPAAVGADVILVVGRARRAGARAWSPARAGCGGGSGA